MKRLLSILLIVIMLATLIVGCSSSEETSDTFMYPVGEAFNKTPQEFIDMVNAVVENKGDSRYKAIPDFVASGEKIEICSFNFTLAITTNDDGYITKLDYDWKLGNDAVNKTAPYIVGITIGCICPMEEAQKVQTQLDMMDASSPKYNTLAKYNGVVFDYDCFYEGKYSELVIYPEV